MVKTEITKKDGTHIVIEGVEEEVKRLVDLIQDQKPKKTRKSKEVKAGKTGKTSIVGKMFSELKHEGFFDKPRSVGDIKNALEERGRIYESRALSRQALTEVRQRNLGRVKKDKKWVYVKSELKLAETRVVANSHERSKSVLEREIF